MKKQDIIQITNPDIDEPVYYVDLQDEVLGYDHDNPVPEANREDAINQQIEQVLSRVVAIRNLIPDSASPLNPLATANDAASFKGSFDTWNDVPQSIWDETTLGTPPSKNDYIIVINSTDYDEQDIKYQDACWRFKYTTPSTVAYSRDNFTPEYNISSTHTPAEEVVFQSGITAQKVQTYDAHVVNPNPHIMTPERTAAVDSGIDSSLVAQITTNQNNITTNASNITINTNDITTINSKIPSSASSTHKLRTSRQTVVKNGSETFSGGFTMDTDIIVTAAGTITIGSTAPEDGREISIIPNNANVFLKINGDTTSGRQLVADIAITYIYENNKWNLIAALDIYQNSITLTGQYTDGTQFSYVIPAISVI